MKSLKKADRYLIFSLAVAILYTIIEQILSVKTGYERSTLTTCVYAFFGTEIGSCAVIKVFNIRHDAEIEEEEGGEG